jgi:redox-sensitive bicupin YhaK (pirin superfamily)
MEIFSYIVSGELEHQDSMGNLEIMKRGDIQVRPIESKETNWFWLIFRTFPPAIRWLRRARVSRILNITEIKSSRRITFRYGWIPARDVWHQNTTLGQGTPLLLTAHGWYVHSHFTDEEKKNTLRQIVAPLGATSVVDEREGTGPAPIHAGVSVFASILSPSAVVTQAYPANSVERKAYIHVVQTSGYNTGPATGARVKVNGGLELGEGDGAFATGEDGDKIEIENVGDKPAEFLLFNIE